MKSTQTLTIAICATTMLVSGCPNPSQGNDDPTPQSALNGLWQVVGTYSILGAGATFPLEDEVIMFRQRIGF